MMSDALFSVALYSLPVFLTLTLPIALQAWIANYLGDSSPKRQGRLSWDPVRHMDTVGTFVIPAMCLFVSGSGVYLPLFFGWAKPLELDARFFRTNLRAFLVESPVFLAPFFIALIWLIILKISGGIVFNQGNYGTSGGNNTSLIALQVNTFHQLCQAGLGVGVMFSAVALLPLPPLPMGNLLLRYLPNPTLFKVMPYLQYSSFILMALMMTGILSSVIRTIAGIELFLLNRITFFL